MPKRWRITYNLAQSIEVQNQVADYPNLEVSLLYDTNKIAGVEHSFNTDDSVDEIGAIGMSQEQLKLFWELLHYKRGFPIAISSRTAEYTTSATGTPGTRTGFASASMSVAIAKLVTMPNQGLFTNPDSRLTVWLRLANDARTAVVDADAIRNYYMIWEDKHGKAELTNAPVAAVELRLVRNFVSHGGDLGDNAVLDLVERELGTSITRYDPTNGDQQRFVQKYRQQARQLIEDELDRLV